MRRILCDQNEFEAGSEQFLELAIAAPSRRCPDLSSLLSACEASAVSGAPPNFDWVRWSRVEEHLRKFAAIELPHPSRFREAALICNDADDIEVGLAFDGHLVWYHWYTTA